MATLNKTPKMQLVVWDEADDAYDHNQLANNWVILDNHNHDPINGGGTPIPTAGILDKAVTAAKLADGAVTSATIADGTIQMVDLALATKMALAPIGEVIDWWRPGVSVSPPAGWVVPIGQALVEPNHDWTGLGTVTLPDLRNTFILGADTGGTGTDPASPPAIGVLGGANTASLAHNHTVNAHAHTVTSHNHVVDPHSHIVNSHTHPDAGHTHTTQAHSHGIGSDGDHNHVMHSRQTRTLANPAPTGNDTLLQTLYVAGFNSGGSDAVVPASGAHTHGGVTGASAPNTDVGVANPATSSPGTSNSSPATSFTSPGTDSQSPGTTSALGTVDIRPRYVGLLRLMKVKY